MKELIAFVLVFVATGVTVSRCAPQHKPDELDRIRAELKRDNAMLACLRELDAMPIERLAANANCNQTDKAARKQCFIAYMDRYLELCVAVKLESK